MGSSRLRLGGVLALGLLAPIWWTFAVSKFTYVVYVWNGSPERATSTLLWTSIYVPSFALGLVAGAIVALALAEAPLKGWLAFFGSLMLGTLVLGAVLGAPSEYISSMFESVGNWFFFIGSAILPVAVWGKKRAG